MERSIRTDGSDGSISCMRFPLAEAAKVALEIGSHCARVMCLPGQAMTDERRAARLEFPAAALFISTSTNSFPEMFAFPGTHRIISDSRSKAGWRMCKNMSVSE